MPTCQRLLACTPQAVTPEEMEAWRMKRARGVDDPLLQAQREGERVSVGGYDLL